ncbi:H17B6 dehydrogenase, partial [Dromaius novaehollandiae]|nr:H17B6 dehydrogenase [Dromaius novaehollandiae]
SVLLTGCDGGVGLGLLKRFLEQPSPPRHLFAACLDPAGKVGRAGRAHEPPPQRLFGVLYPPPGLSKRAAVKTVAERVQGAGLNLLINGGGTTRQSTLETETVENMMLTYTTNTVGPLQVSQAFLPLLMEAARADSRGGLSCSRAAIVNISSSLGSIEAPEAWEQRQDVCYRCSKVPPPCSHWARSRARPRGSLGPPPHQGFWLISRFPRLPQGPVTVEESTQGILSVLATLSATSNGTFLDWKGQRLPW